jgi:hypothetical protein
MNVYKVETIGDCYVAVTGLPQAREDHAIIMCEFARRCMFKMNELTKKLEGVLGPDTSSLSMRFGLHSGPVTAGVLRGERGRFQLFGDTVNTAARIESSGVAGKIHLSKECASEVIAAGQAHWVQQREDLVEAKGKGELQTYWLVKASGPVSEAALSSESNDTDMNSSSFEDIEKSAMFLNQRGQQLIQWNVQRFTELLETIQAVRWRKRMKQVDDNTSSSSTATTDSRALPFEEVKEVIDISAPINPVDEALESSGEEKFTVDPDVIEQLEEFITGIAGMYEYHAFHKYVHGKKRHVVLWKYTILVSLTSLTCFPS